MTSSDSSSSHLLRGSLRKVQKILAPSARMTAHKTGGRVMNIYRTVSVIPAKRSAAPGSWGNRHKIPVPLARTGMTGEGEAA